jgi:hypothetical protein
MFENGLISSETPFIPMSIKFNSDKYFSNLLACNTAFLQG